MIPSLPKPVAVVIAPSLAEYVSRLEELNIFEPDPADEAGAGVRRVLAALHTVLAGGAVTVETVEQGTVSTSEELDRLLAAGIDETRQLNEVFDPGWARA